jgi:hypothetical protein
MLAGSGDLEDNRPGSYKSSKTYYSLLFLYLYKGESLPVGLSRMCKNSMGAVQFDKETYLRGMRGLRCGFGGSEGVLRRAGRKRQNYGGIPQQICK